MKKQILKLLILFFFSNLTFLFSSCKSEKLLNVELQSKDSNFNYYHTLTFLEDGTFKYYISNISFSENVEENLFIELISGTYEMNLKSYTLKAEEMKMFISSENEQFVETTQSFSQEQIQAELESFTGKFSYKIEGNQVLIINQQENSSRIYQIQKSSM